MTGGRDADCVEAVFREEHGRLLAMLVRQFGDSGNVEYIQTRIAQCFAKQDLGIGANRGTPGINVARIDEGGVDAETLHGVSQQVLRAAASCPVQAIIIDRLDEKGEKE